MSDPQQENPSEKRKSVFWIIAAAFGMAIGMIAFVFGIVTLTTEMYHYTRYVRSEITFGADYYTDSYKAMAAAANGIDDACDYLQLITNAFGYLLIVIGLTMLVLFLLKLIFACKDLPKHRRVYVREYYYDRQRYPEDSPRYDQGSCYDQNAQRCDSQAPQGEPRAPLNDAARVVPGEAIKDEPTEKNN